MFLPQFVALFIVMTVNVMHFVEFFLNSGQLDTTDQLIRLGSRIFLALETNVDAFHRHSRGSDTVHCIVSLQGRVFSPI